MGAVERSRGHPALPASPTAGMPRPGIARSSALPQPSSSGWHSHVLPCQGPACSINDEGGGKQCQTLLQVYKQGGFKSIFRSKRKHPQNREGADLGVLQPQQTPSPHQSLRFTKAQAWLSCHITALWWSSESLWAQTNHDNLWPCSAASKHPHSGGLKHTQPHRESQPLAPPPSSACRDGTDGGVRAGHSSQTLPSPDSTPFSSSHCHQL